MRRHSKLPAKPWFARDLQCSSMTASEDTLYHLATAFYAQSAAKAVGFYAFSGVLPVSGSMYHLNDNGFTDISDCSCVPTCYAIHSFYLQ